MSDNLKPRRSRRDYSADELARIGTAEGPDAETEAPTADGQGASTGPRPAAERGERAGAQIYGPSIDPAAPRQSSVTKSVRVSPRTVAQLREMSLALEQSENKVAARLLESMIDELYATYEEGGAVAVFEALKKRGR